MVTLRTHKGRQPGWVQLELDTDTQERQPGTHNHISSVCDVRTWRVSSIMQRPTGDDTVHTKQQQSIDCKLAQQDTPSAATLNLKSS